MCFVVYSVSLSQQLQDVGKKLVGAQHYNKDGSVNNRQEIDSVVFPFLRLYIYLLVNINSSYRLC